MSSSASRDTLRVVFFGTPDFAVFGLKALLEHPDLQVGLVITQPDRPAGRGHKPHFSPVKETARQHGIPLLQPENIRKTESQFLEDLKQPGAFDIGVVIAFGQILPPAVLACPRTGCVNVHASLLPRWRGAAPIQRAILAGDARTGTALMRMEAGLDTGPVYSSAELVIEEHDNFEALHDKLARLGAELLKRDIMAICRGELHLVPQSNIGVTYACKISNQDARIDWSKPAEELARLVRGLSPFPGAFTYLNRQIVKVFRARAQDATPQQPPGTVLKANGAIIEIQCGSGILEVEDLQLAGKKRMSAAEFLRGNPLTEGTLFN